MGGLSCPGCVVALGIGGGVGSDCGPAFDGVPVAVGGDDPDISHPLVPDLRVDRPFAETAEPWFAVRDRGLGQGDGSGLHQLLALRKRSSHLIGHRSGRDGDEAGDPARSGGSTPLRRRGRVPESTDQECAEVLGVVECALRDHARQQLSDVVAISLSASQFRSERAEGVRGGESVDLLMSQPGRPEFCDPPVALSFGGDGEVLGRDLGER